MRSRFDPLKKHSLLCLSLLLSSGCACLPGSDRIVSLNLNLEQSTSPAPITLTGSTENSYVFFNGNAGKMTQQTPPRAEAAAQGTRVSAASRVSLNSNDPTRSARKPGSAGQLPGVVFFSPSSVKSHTHGPQIAAAEPVAVPHPMQTPQVTANQTVAVPRPLETVQLAAKASGPSPQPLVTPSAQPPGRVLMREHLEPLDDGHTRECVLAAALSSQPEIQPAAPASLPRTQSAPLLSATLPSVRRLQPMLTVSQATHRRQSEEPKLTECSPGLAESGAPASRSSVAALTPVITAVLMETPRRVEFTADVMPEQWDSARDAVSEHRSQPAATIVQVSATQPQVFHPQSQPRATQPPLRPIPMMLPPANAGAATNPCDCNPCKETIVHTDQIAALFQRVNDMEAALKRSHQSISTLEKNLNVANSDIVRLKQDVQYWQQEFGRLEASVQKQHESDIAALNRVSEMLGLLIEDATGSTDMQMVIPNGKQNATTNASAAAVTEGEFR